MHSSIPLRLGCLCVFFLTVPCQQLFWWSVWCSLWRHQNSTLKLFHSCMCLWILTIERIVFPWWGTCLLSFLNNQTLHPHVGSTNFWFVVKVVITWLVSWQAGEMDCLVSSLRLHDKPSGDISCLLSSLKLHHKPVPGIWISKLQVSCCNALQSNWDGQSGSNCPEYWEISTLTTQETMTRWKN